MKKRDIIVLCCLFLFTVLLCIVVSSGLEHKEQARIRTAFSMLPECQPETVWCTETGDIILLYAEQEPFQPSAIFTDQGWQRDWELVTISAGYFSLQIKDQPESVMLTGKYYMDDEATLRLEPANPAAEILDGRPRLVFKRYFIADDDCPFFHRRIERW